MPDERAAPEVLAMPFRRRNPDGSGRDFLSYLWICPHRPRRRAAAGAADGAAAAGAPPDDEAMLRSDSCLLVAGIPPDVPPEAASRTVARLMSFGGEVERVVMNTGGASCVVASSSMPRNRSFSA